MSIEIEEAGVELRSGLKKIIPDEGLRTLFIMGFRFGIERIINLLEGLKGSECEVSVDVLIKTLTNYLTIYDEE
jgi:hypothetical protein